MEAGDWRAAADVRRRMGIRVGEIPADPRIPVAEQGHEHVRVQGDLLVGMGSSAAWTGDRSGVGRGLFRLDGGAANPAGLDRASVFPWGAWGRTRGNRLVDGQFGA